MIVIALGVLLAILLIASSIKNENWQAFNLNEIKKPKHVAPAFHSLF